MTWRWATGTARDRGRTVRQHTALTLPDLCTLFCLTESGAEKILAGDDWRPEHSTESDKMSRTAESFYGDEPAKYPERPGFKESTTSKDAANAIENRAGKLRRRVFDAIVAAGATGATADEAAAAIGETVLAVRPRVTELMHSRLIVPTRTRRKNESGMSAKVWRAA